MTEKDVNSQLAVRRYVEKLMKESNHNPADFSFRLVTSNYAESAHVTFNFPGEFVNSLATIVYADDGRILEMDAASLVNPSGIISCKSTVNVEHQSYPVDDIKVDAIYDYKIYLIFKTNIPSNSIIMTNIDPGNEHLYYESHDQIFKIHYIYVDYEEISKRLSMLTSKIDNNEKLSEAEALNFAYIAIFVDNVNAKTILEKLVHLFAESEGIESSLRLDLHQVLRKMIKKHFGDDVAKIRELLTVITETLTRKEFDKLSSYDKSLYKIELKDMIINHQNELISSKDEELFSMGEELSSKDEELFSMGEELSSKDELIENLRKRLALYENNE